MGFVFKRIKYIFLILLCFNLFISCKNSTKTRINLSNSIQYIETPSYYTVGDVSNMDGFHPLPGKDMLNLNTLLSKKSNYIWLKIEFEIPQDLKYKDLGLYIGQFKTADRVWINMIPCGSYGKFPPNELSAGFGAQHFTFHSSSLKNQGKNTIYIQAWTGCQVNLSDKIFIGEEFDAYQAAERRTFFSSRIILCFACISFIAFFIYMFLYLFLKKFSKNKTYLFYSFLMFFSVITLLPFCLYEIPWLKPQHLSYFTIMKVLLTVGIYSTMLFVNLFMVSFLECTESKFIKGVRLFLYIIATSATLMIEDYEQVSYTIKCVFPIICAEFIFSFIPLIKSLRDKRKRTKAIILLLSLVPASVGFVIDLLSNSIINIQILLPYASIYGWQITTYIFIIRLLKQFSDIHNKNLKLKNDMVKFNAKLENEVEIRTKELSEKNFILSRGLEAITLVQQEVLPKNITSFRGWDVSTKYIPLDNEVSGDLYDYYFYNSSLQGLTLIDVSGHGIPAGLMTILAKGIINQQYLSGVSNSRSLTEILTIINQVYIQEKVNVENYFTCLLFNFEDFDKDDICKIQMANAGHPAPILYKSGSNTLEEVKYNDPGKQYGFIGVDGLPISFPTTEFSMEQNDILVCFTDGITEAMNQEKEEYSKERLMKIIQENKDLSSMEIKDKIMENLESFLQDKKLSDDLTLIVLKRNNSKDFLEEI